MGNIGDEVKKIYGSELTDNKKKNPSGSGRNNKLWGTVLLVITIVIVILPAIYYWNQFVSLQQRVLLNRGNIEKEYRRREDLIPNAIKVAQQYARHERELFRHVSDVRRGLDSLENFAEVDGIVSDVLSKIVALSEEYPALRATESFQVLMKQIETQESRLADTRESYNRATRVYNTLVKSFPSTIYNFVFFRNQFKEAQYFFAGVEEAIAVEDLTMMGTFPEKEDADVKQ